jgi:hypothetical protein
MIHKSVTAANVIVSALVGYVWSIEYALLCSSALWTIWFTYVNRVYMDLVAYRRKATIALYEQFARDLDQAS